MLNDDKANLVNMEEKLRSLAKTLDVHVMAFYDVCRSDKSKFPMLKTRGGETEQGETDLFGQYLPYSHICTQPLQVVNAKSKLC